VCRLAALLGLVLLVGVSQAAPARDRLDVAGELTIARRTRAAVADRLREREGALGKRVRILYKLTRAGLLPLVADQGARADLTRRRALARRLIVRDLEERAALRTELGRADDQVRRLETELGRAELAVPAGLILRPPVPRAPMPTRRRDRATGARLLELDARFAAEMGENATAPAAGVVRYAGPVHGRQTGVILALGDGLSVVVSGLGSTRVAAGDQVEAGAVLGRAGEHGVAVALYCDDRAVPTLLHLARP
jgi:murein DD-endopeptidase MepM/ murein hydrolase activator NlpD